MEFPITQLLGEEQSANWILMHFHPDGLKCPGCWAGVEHPRYAHAPSAPPREAACWFTVVGGARPYTTCIAVRSLRVVSHPLRSYPSAGGAVATRHMQRRAISHPRQRARS